MPASLSGKLSYAASSQLAISFLQHPPSARFLPEVSDDYAPDGVHEAVHEELVLLRGSLLVRHCWETWRHRRETTKAWVEACKRSEIYKDKVQRGRIPATMSASVMREKPDQSLKKRRISAPTELATSQIRRLKRRKSNQFAQPLTDEALARRLQEVCRCLPAIVYGDSPRVCRTTMRTRNDGLKARSVRLSSTS